MPKVSRDTPRVVPNLAPRGNAPATQPASVPSVPLPPTSPPSGRTTAGQPGSVLGLQLEVLKQGSTRQQVIRESTEQLVRRVLALEAKQGIGFEQWGKGDPDVIVRRGLVAQLLLLPESVRPTQVLERPFARVDAAMLKRFDRRDTPRTLRDVVQEVEGSFTAAGLKAAAEKLREKAAAGQIETFANLADWVWRALPASGDVRTRLEPLYWTTILQDRMAQNAKVNTERAETAAGELTSGKQTFFAMDPQRFSTQILTRLSDPELRARTLVDMLLQCREPIAQGLTFEKDTAGGAGIQSVMEMRAYLASLPATPASDEAAREQALARAVVLANPVSSSNAVLEARHLVGKLRRLSWQLVYGKDAIPPGTQTHPYQAIHHNFSVETPRVIEAFVGEVVFGGGDPQTFCRLVDAMNAARDGTEAAQARLDEAWAADPAARQQFMAFAAEKPELALGKQLEAFLVSRCKGKLDSAAISSAVGLSDTERTHLSNGEVTGTKGAYDEKLTLVARLYRVLCESMPTASTLRESMFSARGAMPAVAQAIAALETKAAPPLAVLRALTDARAALQEEYGKTSEGHRRVELLRLDAQLESLTATRLGGAVDGLGDMKSAPQQVAALGSMQVALESAALSGLDQLRDLGDARTGRGPTIKQVAGEIRDLFTAGSVDLGTYQATMARAYEAIVRTTENVRSYVEARVPDVSEGHLVPNPAFVDDFIKEGPLHYARAIAQRALRVGLEAEISPRRIVNPDGVSVLNPLGRVVFDRVVIADSMSDLQALNAGRGDMCWVRKMDEKKMIAVGGIMADFPGGYCHAAVYARGAGIAALSNPELSAQWVEFAQNLQGDQLYYDDTGGRIVMMPLTEAERAGLVKPGEAARLKPGSNRTVTYSTWSEAEQAYQKLGEHAVVVDLERSTEHVELFGTPGPIKGLGEKAMSFEDIGAMGTAARGLFGEKSLVLALATQSEVLKPLVPPGSALSTIRVQRMLDAAGLLEPWNRVWQQDPEVGPLTDANFLESRFYTDAEYRRDVREGMKAAVHEKLGEHLIGVDGKPTAAGRELLAELRGNAKLAACDNWIVRSSFTAEDRPGKSGAGQYDSFPNCRTDAEILRGVVGVVASAWEAPPIENNVREEYNLSRIWPAITVMECLAPEYSGVMVSRDTGTGHRRTASFQAVEGFGGGVEDGVTEQGKLREGGALELSARIPGRPAPLVDAAMGTQLWRVAMEAERLFHKVVEPGRGLAVDMEWCVAQGQLKLVQARTIRA